MTPINKTAALDGRLNGRQMTLLGGAALVVVLAAIASAWLVVTPLLGQLEPSAREVVFEEPGYADFALRHAPAVEIYPDLGLRRRAQSAVVESYPDLGLRSSAAARSDQHYPDFGQRHRRAGAR